MKENTETIIAMLEELLTVSKSRQASQSGCTNMDITSIKSPTLRTVESSASVLSS